MRNGRQQWLPAHNPSQGAPSSWSNPMIGFGDHYEVKQSLSAFLFTVYRGRRRRRGGKKSSLVWLLLALSQSDGSYLSVCSLAGGVAVQRDVYHAVEGTRPHFQRLLGTQHRDGCSALLLSYTWPRLSVFKCLSLQKCRTLILGFSCPQAKKHL